MFGLLPVLLAVSVLCGCRTARPLPAVNLAEPGWRTRQGQAVWRSRTNAPELAGDLLLATHPDGRTFLQFTKTPLPLIVAQTSPGSWQIEFVADNRLYSGRGEPPAQLGWLQLARCLAGAVPSKKCRWEQFGDGRWRLANRSSGEVIEGYF